MGGSSAQPFRGLRRVDGVDTVVVQADYVAAPTFESLFAAEYGRVVGLAFVLCGRRVVAEEVAQDAFVQAYRRWSVVSGYDDPPSSRTSGSGAGSPGSPGPTATLPSWTPTRVRSSPVTPPSAPASACIPIARS